MLACSCCTTLLRIANYLMCLSLTVADENKESILFRTYPFTFKLNPVSAARRAGTAVQRKCHACDSCGSVIVMGSSQARLLRINGRMFCDIQCAGDYKRWHNRTTAYQDGCGITEARRRKASASAEQTKLRWKCCEWCWSAFIQNHPATKCCSASCRDELAKVSRTTNYANYRSRSANPVATEVICLHCGASVVKNRDQSISYCGDKCGKKAAKLRRKMRIRTNGGYEPISLENLIEAFSGKCVECSCETTRYNGEYRHTDASIDHIFPISRGGTHTIDNLQLMCHLCNSRKSDIVDTLF